MPVPQPQPSPQPRTGGLGRGRHSEYRIAVLVRAHSPHKSITELGKAIGEKDLPGRLDYARNAHQLPNGDVLAKIAGELDDVGRALMVDALAWDGRLPGYDVADEPLQRAFSRVIRGLPPQAREAVLTLLVLAGRRPVGDVDVAGFEFASEVLFGDGDRGEG